MKIGLKENGFEVDANLEGLAEKALVEHNKDWKYKLKTKQEMKKELLNIKHKNKMQEREWKLNNKKPGLFASKKKKEEYALKQKRKQRKPLFVGLCVLGSVMLGFFANQLNQIYGCVAFGIGCAILVWAITNLSK